MRSHFRTIFSCCCVLALLVGCGGTESDTGDPVDEPLPTITGEELTPPFVYGDPAPAPPERLPPRPSNVKPPLDPQVLYFRDGGMLSLEGDSHLDMQLAGDLTLEFWIRTESTKDKEILRAENLKIGIRAEHFRARIAGRELFGPQIGANEWYHVSLVVHGESIRFYVNGHKSDTLETNGEWSRPASPIIMGQTESEMERRENIFVGKVDNLRLIHHAIRNDHFTPEQHLAQNDLMVFGFSFDGLTERMALDHSTNGYNAELHGGVGWAPGAI